MKKTSLAILTLTAAASISFAAETAAPKTIKATIPMAPKVNFDFLPEVVAEVSGKKLTKTQVLQQLLPPAGKGQIPKGVTQETLKKVTIRMATQFVQATAILDAAIKAGYKPSPELAVKGFNESLKTAPAFRLEQIKKGLAKQGKTLESFLEERKTDKAFQDQIAIQTFFREKVINKYQVTTKAAKAYYDANPKAFKMNADPKGSMRASHILITVDKKADAKTKAIAKAKAEKLLALLKKDASLFGELAEKESSCPSSAKKGSLGVFKKGNMVPEFEQAVVNLKTGEISAIVETKFGYHIIRRDAPKKATKETFAEVKDKLQAALKQQQVEQALKAFVKKITDAAKGKVYIK